MFVFCGGVIIRIDEVARIKKYDGYEGFDKSKKRYFVLIFNYADKMFEFERKNEKERDEIFDKLKEGCMKYNVLIEKHGLGLGVKNDNNIVLAELKELRKKIKKDRQDESIFGESTYGII